MAATSLSIPLAGVQACATSGRRRTSSANWWTPLFGWSSEPDYIDSNNNNNKPAKLEAVPAARESKTARPRFAGGFTEEKARQFRKMTVGTDSFHDTMYHSAIASRLASDFEARSDSDL
ncbi:uncharacterized protein LOC109812130 [Cajanus cajan]|uniref:Uncharacterized protein n=1 Tax=Cajanus cajan TaxID=3821 RepID=A0A151S8Q4_CAJCA|nr:uncharacterized protein LOC109812130 [Cajanus cajan]KYP51147.1 hypothetical protein KK1_027064 [Cajanus cajan]